MPICSIFLKVVLSRNEPHLLQGQMYYLRSQLAMKMAQQGSDEERGGLWLLRRVMHVLC